MFRTNSNKDQYYRDGKTAADRFVRQCMKDGKDVDLVSFIEENNRKFSTYAWQKAEFERGVREIADKYGIPMPAAQLTEEHALEAIPAISKPAKRKRTEDNTSPDLEIDAPAIKIARLEEKPIMTTLKLNNPPLWIFAPLNISTPISKKPGIRNLEDEAVEVLAAFEIQYKR